MVYRPFFWIALVFALAGTTVGLTMLFTMSGWIPSHAWALHLKAHGQMQVVGFVVIFTLGMALQILAQVFGEPPRAATRLCLASMTAGTLLRLFTWHGVILQVVGALAFLVAVIPRGEHAKKRTAHSMFMRVGTLWLLAAFFFPEHTLWLLLWGFASTFIMGVGLRTHPEMLGRSEPAERVQYSILALWSASLFDPQGAFGASVGLLAVLLLLGALKPSRGFLAVSYVWLLLASLGRLGLALDFGSEPAVRHALASGFILTMMLGMAFHLIPAFENVTVRWAWRPALCIAILTLGGVLRVGAQFAAGPMWLVAAGGAVQTLAVLIFVIFQARRRRLELSA